MIHCISDEIARFAEIAKRKGQVLDRESFFADLLELDQPIRVCIAFIKDKCEDRKCPKLHLTLGSKYLLRQIIERAEQGGFEVHPSTYKAAGLKPPVPRPTPTPTPPSTPHT